jgi:diguanylate cyclase (GGDEF)-like protein/PAS domain S-box-containing protein
MTKRPDIIILYALLASFVFVVTDSLVDTFIFQRGPFMQMLLYDYDEIYFRLLVTASFLVFGLIIGRAFKARLRVEDELIESRERYSSLVNSTSDFIFVVDRNCMYLFMNRIYLSRMQISDNQYIGRQFNEFHSQETSNIFFEIVKKVFVNRESLDNEFQSEKDGNYYLQTFSPVKDKYGNIVAVTVISKEINDRKKMEERLRKLTITDDLTGLLNRRGFFLLAKKQLMQARRDKKSVFLISADLDNLKTINDRYGHSEGDIVLMEISNILEKCYRESDIIARLGGDEFVVLMNECPGTDIESLTGRLKENIDSFNDKSLKPYTLSISVGIIQNNPDKNATLDELLSHADQLMYAVKAEKRKCQDQTVPVIT